MDFRKIFAAGAISALLGGLAFAVPAQAAPVTQANTSSCQIIKKDSKGLISTVCFEKYNSKGRVKMSVHDRRADGKSAVGWIQNWNKKCWNPQGSQTTKTCYFDLTAGISVEVVACTGNYSTKKLSGCGPMMRFWI
ncbi:hypothetical protein ACWGQ9_05130 [Streptomyces parvus]